MLPDWVYIAVPAIGLGATIIAIVALIRGGQHDDWRDDYGTKCPYCDDADGIRCCEFGRDR